MDPRSLSFTDWLDYAYATLIDMPDGMVDRHDVIAKMDEVLSTPIPTPATVDRRTWGRDPQAQAGQRAMMALAGGPAPMRPAAEEAQPS